MTTGGPPNCGSLPVRLKFTPANTASTGTSKVVRKRRGTIGCNAVTFPDDVDGLRRAVLPIQVVVEIERGLLRERGSDVGGNDSRQVVRRATAERHIRSRQDVAEHRALRNEYDDNQDDEAEANPPIEATVPVYGAVRRGGHRTIIARLSARTGFAKVFSPDRHTSVTS